jgi:hypothetical protein
MDRDRFFSGNAQSSGVAEAGCPREDSRDDIGNPHQDGRRGRERECIEFWREFHKCLLRRIDGSTMLALPHCSAV